MSETVLERAIWAEPFHADELAAQRMAGVATPGAAIRPFMPGQHRSFFTALPYVALGAVDADGWPVATMLAGAPGFITTPDPATLRIALPESSHDPALQGLFAGFEAAILGIDFATRRRNRANGQLASANDQAITIAVRQSFGNCPKYIHRRSVEPAMHQPSETERFDGLDRAAADAIAAADTFFVASRSATGIREQAGADISHRGGPVGFVAVDGDTLTIPDFRGNRYFNTLGNLLGEPRAALLFPDFETGDLLQLQGLVTIDWHDDADGVERTWRMQVKRGWRRPGALPLRWRAAD